MSFDPGPLAKVGYRPNADRWTLVFTRDLRHSPEKVWASLTEPAQLGAWAPYTTDRDLGSVGKATLTMVDGSTEVALPCEVTIADPPTLLEYEWGGDVLRWTVEATSTGSRLTLEHTVKERESVPQIAAGWHLCLVVAESLLDGEPIGPIRGQDAMNYGWSELNEAYAKTLDIPVSTSHADNAASN
jgi:uncharacterized protein YndB with AHSA1/START domain